MFRKAEVKVVAANYARRNMLAVSNLTVPDRPGELFLSFVQQSNIIAMQDGEDSAGNSRQRPMTPDEVVERAAQLVTKSFERMEKEDWLVQYPTYDELEAADTGGHQQVGFAGK
jgi:hypothetical protein